MDLTPVTGSSIALNLPMTDGGVVSSSVAEHDVPRSGMECSDALDSLLLPVNGSLIASRKQRGRAFFIAMCGALFHQKRLVHLILGLRQGSEKDLRFAWKRLKRYIQKKFDVKIEYRATWVREKGRLHVHILSNMPYVPQAELLAKIQEYLGEQASVYIRKIKETSKDRLRAVRYVMQYMSNQKGLVRFSQSRHWLPVGCERHWREMKSELREQDAGLLNSPEWREALIGLQDEWILSTREAIDRRDGL